MPANTTRGYPYPVGTDRVADGDDAIKALAEAVDTKLTMTQMRSGSFVGNSDASGVVNVPHPLGVIPTVVLVAATHRSDRLAGVFKAGVTTALIPVTVRNAAGGAVVVSEANCRIDWIAIV